MNFIEYLDQQARQFKQTMDSFDHTTPVPVKDWGWENYCWSSPLWRSAHLEIFNQDRFMVVHLCIFPNVTDPSPIFGFDVISGVNKVTGLFMDLSPTQDATEPFNTVEYARGRDLPDWGEIFSAHWIAVRPNDRELMDICNQTQSLLPKYVAQLGQKTGDINIITASQNRYCSHQQKNPHTRRALDNLIGSDATEEFMSTVLFPQAK